MKLMATPNHSTQVDAVIRHIRTLLDSGRLFPGDRLPAERKIAEQLGVSRSNVRTALQKLEFYGIVKTYPQSGTIVAQHTVQVLEGLISDMMKIDGFDFYSLVYVRVLLEVEAIRLCAMNRTEEDIESIRTALEEFDRYADTDRRIEKDFAFHSAIAQAAHNPVIASLLLVITPDVLNYYLKYQVCTVPIDVVQKEHHAMLDSIIARDPDGAEKNLRTHLAMISAFAEETKAREFSENS